jgi:hypothetical protein
LDQAFEEKGEFMKLLERESGVRDPAVAALIHEEIIKLYSDTGLVSDEAMEEFVVNSKEALKASRQVSPSEIADFSFARRAAADLKEGK